MTQPAEPTTGIRPLSPEDRADFLHEPWRALASAKKRTLEQQSLLGVTTNNGFDPA